jgi:hypothetical protein
MDASAAAFAGGVLSFDRVDHWLRSSRTPWVSAHTCRHRRHTACITLIIVEGWSSATHPNTMSTISSGSVSNRFSPPSRGACGVGVGVGCELPAAAALVIRKITRSASHTHTDMQIAVTVSFCSGMSNNAGSCVLLRSESGESESRPTFPVGALMLMSTRSAAGLRSFLHGTRQGGSGSEEYTTGPATTSIARQSALVRSHLC